MEETSLWTWKVTGWWISYLTARQKPQRSGCANRQIWRWRDRDRGGEYASAAREGAPQAVQCADRFHLLKNLREALEGLLARHLAAQCKRETQAILDEQAPVWQPTRATRSSPTLLRLQQSRREERLAHYEQVIALRKLGLSQAAIARQVGIGASTVQSWLAAGAFPERKPADAGEPP